jgi:regulator of CtrA degradation
MELTTRLMQAASWLVMHKAVRDGDMSAEDAAARKYRIRRDEPAIDPRIGKSQGLPVRFVDLVTRAEALFEQVCRLDQALYPDASPPVAANTVTGQQAALRQAAEAGAFDPGSPHARRRKSRAGSQSEA